MPFIEVKNISKTFKVPVRNAGLKETIKNFFNREYKYIDAVKDISFNIEKGEIIGYIGPNGAGKSTTIKILSGILTPSSGSVLVDHHFNASSNPNATGTEVIVSNNANANSKALAKELAEGTACILGIANRGVKTEAQTARGRIGILNLNAGIACLVEIAFLSNPNDMVKYELKKDELARFYADTYIKYDNLI